MRLGTKETPALRLGAAVVLKAYLGGNQVWPLGFDPASLFAQGEQGVWYDPSDFSTMFQDVEGTVPVTAVEQPVGLMLDKSKGLAPGPELVTNGTFDTDDSWTLGTGWSIANGVASYSGSLINNKLKQTRSGQNGKTYKVTLTFTMKNTPNANARVVFNLGGGGQNVFVESQGSLQNGQTYTITGYGTPTTVSVFEFQVNSNLNYQMDFDVDNISVRELPGNHASQPTATARGLYKDTPKRIDYDGIDDLLTTTFPINLGSNCTVARAVPSVGAQILTAQTIGTNYEDSTDHAGLIIINRALTAAETAAVTSYLNRAY